MRYSYKSTISIISGKGSLDEANKQAISKSRAVLSVVRETLAEASNGSFVAVKQVFIIANVYLS